MTTLAILHQNKAGNWTKITITRSHTRLRPALREQGSSKWFHKGVEKSLVRRWHGELGKFRLLVQRQQPMTADERDAWYDPTHLVNSRRLQ